jgi:hypothetical protein
MLVPRESGPIVVIGMHRSGTRVVADLLDRLGVFMGADRQADAESAAFIVLNESILHQCGAFWSEPMAAHFVLADADTVSALATRTAELLQRYLPSYTGQAPQRPRVGWKDPRNTFTLPVWRTIFPDLKVIHVLRHGVDVASSLSLRHADSLRAATGRAIPGALTVIRDNALGVLSTRRGWTQSEALTMWEQYVAKAREGIAALGANALEIRYEDLFTEPGRAIAAIAAFCDVPESGAGAAFASTLKSDRCFAYRRDPELVRFAESHSEILEQYGYFP